MWPFDQQEKPAPKETRLEIDIGQHSAVIILCQSNDYNEHYIDGIRVTRPEFDSIINAFRVGLMSPGKLR